MGQFIPSYPLLLALMFLLNIAGAPYGGSTDAFLKWLNFANVIDNIKRCSRRITYQQKGAYMVEKLTFFIETAKELKRKLNGYENSKSLKRLKIFLLSISASLCIIILILSGITIFINPNEYKYTIEKKVLEDSGKILLLKGPLHLRWFPQISLEAHDIILKNRPNSKSLLLKAEIINIYPSIWHLLFGNMAGKIEVTNLRLKNFYFQKLITKIKFKKNHLKLIDIQIDINKGWQKETLQINRLKIDMSMDTPKYYLEHQTDDFKLPLLLSVLGYKTPISGITELKLNLFAEGKTLSAIKRNLSGSLEIEIKKGKIYGIDLIDSLREAKSLLETLTHKLSNTLSSGFDLVFHRRHSPTGITPFDAIKFKAVVHKGILHTEILNVKHRHYHLKGKGHLNLSKNTLEFQVEALYKKNGVLKQRLRDNKPTPLIINISGSCKSPKIQPDFRSYFQYVRAGDGKLAEPRKSKKTKRGKN